MILCIFATISVMMCISLKKGLKVRESILSVEYKILNCVRIVFSANHIIFFNLTYQRGKQKIEQSVCSFPSLLINFELRNTKELTCTKFSEDETHTHTIVKNSKTCACDVFNMLFITCFLPSSLLVVRSLSFFHSFSLSLLHSFFISVFSLYLSLCYSRSIICFFSDSKRANFLLTWRALYQFYVLLRCFIFSRPEQHKSAVEYGILSFSLTSYSIYNILWGAFFSHRPSRISHKNAAFCH